MRAFNVDQPSRSATHLNCLNKTDCACNKQENVDEIFNKMTNRKEHPQTSEKLERILDCTSGTDGTNGTNEMTENEYD